jgi:hypothetical protein
MMIRTIVMMICTFVMMIEGRRGGAEARLAC